MNQLPSILPFICSFCFFLAVTHCLHEESCHQLMTSFGWIAHRQKLLTDAMVLQPIADLCTAISHNRMCQIKNNHVNVVVFLII